MPHRPITFAVTLLASVFIVSRIVPEACAADAAAPGEADSVENNRADHESDEQRVLAFVEEHQPELARVLKTLRERKPEEHARAVAELARTVAKLDAARAKDERLHELELEMWQSRTRVDLLVARWMAARRKDRPAIEAKLREAVDAELDVRAEQLTHRRQRSVAWYDRQIERLRDKRDELVAARLKSLLDDDAEQPKAAAVESR